MLLLIGFAFLAGIVTVLSPCILPVLPVVLSGGLGGGKARPWGVITGFTASFTVFTLTLSTLVQTLGLDPDLLRWIAAGLILVFGIVLVVPFLKDKFMAWTTALVSRSSAPVRPGKPAGGYWSGVVLGSGPGSGLDALRGPHHGQRHQSGPQPVRRRVECFHHLGLHPGGPRFLCSSS